MSAKFWNIGACWKSKNQPEDVINFLAGDYKSDDPKKRSEVALIAVHVPTAGEKMVEQMLDQEGVMELKSFFIKKNKAKEEDPERRAKWPDYQAAFVTE